MHSQLHATPGPASYNAVPIRLHDLIHASETDLASLSFSSMPAKFALQSAMHDEPLAYPLPESREGSI